MLCLIYYRIGLELTMYAGRAFQCGRFLYVSRSIIDVELDADFLECMISLLRMNRGFSIGQLEIS